jgi:hypothetical protein
MGAGFQVNVFTSVTAAKMPFGKGRKLTARLLKSKRNRNEKNHGFTGG